MIFDHRLYTFRPGTVNKQFDLYAKYGRDAQTEALGGEPVISAQTETGVLNTFIHIWAYEDIAERTELRANMGKDPRWAEYIKHTGENGYLTAQENRILHAAPFFKYSRRPKAAKAGGGAPLIFDHRKYTTRPGKVMNQLGIYEKYGFEAQKKYLGEPVLYAHTETGELNTFIHIWAYDSPADRDAKRKAMAKDEGWAEFRRHSAEAGNLVSQENRILLPAPFFSLQR